MLDITGPLVSYKVKSFQQKENTILRNKFQEFVKN